MWEVHPKLLNPMLPSEARVRIWANVWHFPLKMGLKVGNAPFSGQEMVEDGGRLWAKDGLRHSIFRQNLEMKITKKKSPTASPLQQRKQIIYKDETRVLDLVNVKSFLLIITPKLINTHSPKNCWQCYFESTWVVTLYLKTPFWKIQIFGL